VVTLTVLAVAFDRAEVIDWIGGYPVQVRVERSSPRPVSGLAAAVLFRREWELTEGDPARIDFPWQVVSGAGREPFTVQVQCGGKNSGLGRQISYVRQEVLVLKVSYADGGSGLVVAELPGSRSSRELSVQVP
jgi:hypothetical protein